MNVNINSKNESEILALAKAEAAAMPDLLVEAKQMAQSIMAGWHGRRQAGAGDVFWQFRAYDKSESVKRIDWRRSARDDSLTVRDHEWQAAITFWMWADNSPSMKFKSQNAKTSKQNRALLIVLALAEVLAQSGERVGWPGLTKSTTSRQSAENIAARLSVEKPQDDLPKTDNISSSSDFIIVGDFLMNAKKIEEMVHDLAKRNIRGMLIHIIDPAEENFPYSGRTEFHDIESNSKLTFGRAQSIKEEYIKMFEQHKNNIKQICKKSGWFHIAHHTNQNAQTVLAKAHTMLQGNPNR